MDAMTYTQVRQNFAAVMNDVCDDHAPVIITRQRSEPVVLMSLADYNSIQETLYLMKSPANYAHLMQSIEEVKKGRVQARELLDE